MFVFGFLLCTDGGRPVECGDAPQTQSRRAEERSGKMRSLKLRVGTSGKVSEPHDDDIGTYHAGGAFLGARRVGKALEWSAPAGTHELAVADDLGRTSTMRLTIRRR